MIFSIFCVRFFLNIIRFVYSTRREQIKFYIREFTRDISRDREHRVSLPLGTERFQKTVNLFEMLILPLLL